MKLNKVLAAAFMAVGIMSATPAAAQSLSPSTKWHWDKGTIVVDTPARPAGQQHVLGLKTDKIQTVRVAFVGLGMRGPGAVERFTYIPGVEIVALCDYEAERAERCQGYLKKAGLLPAAIYSGEKGYEELCKRPDIDLVYVATDWDHHFPVAKCALENGKHTAIEVPSAMNLEQCWELINLSEKMRKHCMILENCCYDWFELDALNMAQHGVFGEVIRAQGAYIHNLDDFWGYYWSNPSNDPDKLGWRMKYNKENRGDVYATTASALWHRCSTSTAETDSPPSWQWTPSRYTARNTWRRKPESPARNTATATTPPHSCAPLTARWSKSSTT